MYHDIIAIDDKLVSTDLLRVQFVCDLEACKGACCVEGDMGAPLDADELPILDAIYPQVEPYLSDISRQAIAEQGRHLTNEAGHHTTPLVNGAECAYVVFEGGTSFCAIERAWKDGKIDYQKPISCHLYPVRLKDMHLMDMTAVNYEKWSICKPACKLGASLKVPLYKFLKAPLTRKFGQEWYDKMAFVLEAYGSSIGKQ